MPVEAGLNPIEHEGQRGALATVADISERKAVERRQQILMNEIRHAGPQGLHGDYNRTVPHP